MVVQAHHVQQRRADVPGFALIELLVVISIIALLIAVLLPGLSAARRQSKQAACLTRLKNISTASHVYAADDTKGLVIPVHHELFAQSTGTPTYVGAYEWGGKSGIGEPGYVDGPATGEYAWVSSRWGTRAGFGPATRPLNAVLYPAGIKDNLNPRFDRAGAEQDTKLDLDSYRCPADDGPPRGGGAHCPYWIQYPDRSAFDHFGTSYAANIAFHLGPESGVLVSFSPFLLPMSRIPNASNTLLYEENIGRWAWACARWPQPYDPYVFALDPGPTKSLRGWHGKDWTYNRSFVDGHAATQRIMIEGTHDDQGYSEHFRAVHYGRHPRGVPDRGWTIRGDAWQKDVTPAYTWIDIQPSDGPPLYTGLFEGCVTPGLR